jgi:putative transposase
MVKQFLFTPEEKLAAVKETTERGRTVASVAREFRVAEITVSRWQKKYIADAGETLTDRSGNPKGKEMLQLKRRLKDTEAQIDFYKKAFSAFRIKPREKYAIIDKYAGEIGTTAVCALLGTYINRHYTLRNCPRTMNTGQQDAELTERLKQIFYESNRTYGANRLLHALRKSGYNVGMVKVGQLINEAGLVGAYRKRYTKHDYTKRNRAACPNLLRKDSAIENTGSVWLTDIIHIRTGEGRLFLCYVLDFSSKHVVGWAVSSRPDRNLAIAAFENAINNQNPSKWFILHSNQNALFSSSDYKRTVDMRKGVQSMSASGCPADARTKSFTESLKNEGINLRRLATKRQAQGLIDRCIKQHNS